MFEVESVGWNAKGGVPSGRMSALWAVLQKEELPTRKLPLPEISNCDGTDASERPPPKRRVTLNPPPTAVASSAVRFCRKQSEAFRIASEDANLTVFAEEIPHPREEENRSIRRFLVGSYEQAWNYLRALPAERRHLYEIIRHGVACHLYFDLEFSRVFNPHMNADLECLLMEGFRQRLTAFLRERIPEHPIEEWIDLESSNVQKFSRHLIIRLKGARFLSNIHVGELVAQFCQQLSEEREKGKTQENATTDKSINANDNNADANADANGDANANGDGDGDAGCDQGCREQSFNCALFWQMDGQGQQTLFVDLGVYTKNRMFRTLYSLKWGKSKTAALQRIDRRNSISLEPSTLAEQPPLTRSDFLTSLITWPPLHLCPLGSIELVRTLPAGPMPSIMHWRKFGTQAEHGTKGEGGNNHNQKGNTMLRIEGSGAETAHHLPQLSSYFLTLIHQRLSTGQLASFRIHGDGDRITLVAGGGYRWCACAGRSHRSNNVYFLVDVRLGCWVQKCFDPDCKGRSSPPMALPTQVWQECCTVCQVEVTTELPAWSMSDEELSLLLESEALAAVIDL